MRLLEDYLRTSDPELREKIELVSGEHEILASKIYRAFWVYVARHQPHEEEMYAERLLEENPRLTLTLLRPILREAYPEESVILEKGDAFLHKKDLVEKGKSIYVNLAASFSMIESDGFARGVLDELAQSEDKEIAELAEGLAAFIDQNREHYLLKAEDYRKNKGWNDLQWFKIKYLGSYAVSGLTKPDIDKLLGAPDYSDGAVYIYWGKRDYPEGNHLWIYFLDGVYSGAEWGDAPDA